ncbi:CDP-alcohol phosphatidyltransferase family protein [Nocardioides sp. GXQ0305]|uniref:CDP-alcohol phosphatidyltransferase family protein n=1 Tax=Nocardioides sp. GXQ0305 TaxID=3423912 RepID=UPI003D7CAD31
MRSVQTTPPRRALAAREWVVTGLAAGLVLAALTVPSSLEELGVPVLLRLPVELLVLLAVVLALPPRLARARTAVALTGGVVLGLVAVFRLLDIGFVAALNRPFDPLIDWRYAGSLVELVRDAFGGLLGTTLLVVSGLVVVAVLALVPMAVVRLCRVAAGNRRPAAAVVGVLSLGWLSLAVLDVRGPAGPVASSATAGYVEAQVARVPGQLRDRREFLVAARDDPLRDVPAGELFAGLRGKDVLVVFVESYGRLALEDPELAPGVTSVLAAGDRRLERAGFASRSAYLTSPTFGALSWLAHATLQSGLWIDSQPRYDVLVTSPRLTLTSLFGRAGWRTVAAVPANNRDWPQGEFYGFDQVYDSRNIGYEGPRFGYPTMPDQYTLDAVHRLELAPTARRPVMAEVDLITSHAPWSRTPRLVDQAAVGDGSVFEGMPEQLPSEADIWPDRDRIRQAYGHAVEYSLRAFVRFLTTYGDDDLVVVLLGDHQPATVVSGPDAGHEVPVSVLARDPAVLDRIAGWDWDRGLRPGPDAPVWPMDAFRDRFVAAYSAGGENGAASGAGR